MASKTSIAILVYLALCTYKSNAQDCLEYPDIGGGECVACAPE